MTVDYQELQGSYASNIGREDSSAARSVIVAWEDKEQFISEVLGNSTLTGTTQEYIPPSVHPDYSYLFAVHTSCQGLGIRGLDERGIIKYEKAEITVTYGIIRDPAGGGGDSERDRSVFISESRTTGFEHWPIKSKNFYWLNAPVTFYDLLRTGGRIPDNHVHGPGRVRAHNINASDINFDEPVGEEVKARIVVPRMEISIDIHWWFNYPDDDFKICQLLGTVNDDYYRPLLTTYPPQTLLLGGIDRKRQYTSQGITAWQISYKFLLNVNGWNTSYREERWKDEIIDVGVLGGTPVKQRVIDSDWPPGWYPVATATEIDYTIVTEPIPGEGAKIVYPYQLANFRSNLLPQGFRQSDFGDEVRP